MEINDFISTLNKLITGVLDESPVNTIGSITGDYSPFTLNCGSSIPTIIRVDPLPANVVLLVKPILIY